MATPPPTPTVQCTAHDGWAARHEQPATGARMRMGEPERAWYLLSSRPADYPGAAPDLGAGAQKRESARAPRRRDPDSDSVSDDEHRSNGGISPADVERP